MRFVTLSATMAGVADVKEAVKCAKNEQTFGRRTVLFIDEIHRFNKLQQARFWHLYAVFTFSMCYCLLLVYNAVYGLATHCLADFCQPVSAVSGRSIVL